MKKDSKLFEVPLKALGERIKAVREKLEVTRKDFSDTLSFTPRIIRMYEQGLAKPGFEFFFQAIECFKINPLFLITGQGDMFIDKGEDPAIEIRWPDGFEPDADGQEMLEYYLKSKLVRLNLHAYFNGLLIREGDTIKMDMEKGKGSGKK